MSGLAVRAEAWGGAFCLCFCCCFHFVKWMDLKGETKGAISTKVQAKHRSQPQFERLGHYGSFSWFGEIYCAKEKCCVGFVDARHFIK